MVRRPRHDGRRAPDAVAVGAPQIVDGRREARRRRAGGPGRPARQAIDTPVEAGDDVPTVFSGEQVANHESHRTRASRPSRQASRSGATRGSPLRAPVSVEPGDGLARVEVDMPALLAHDPAEQFGQHRVSSASCEACVPGLRGPLVHRTPRHVHCGVRSAYDRRAEAVHKGRHPVPPAKRLRNGAMRPAGRLAGPRAPLRSPRRARTPRRSRSSRTS